MISYLEMEVVGIAESGEEITIVNLLSVYDKSERETVSTEELLRLIASIQD